MQTIVVARFLDPAEYGLVAAALVAVGLAGAFADGGLSAAVIARRLSGAELSSLYWFTVLVGACAAAIVALTAPLVASYFGEPKVAELLRWAAPIFLISPVGAQFFQILNRELEFRRLAIVQVLAVVTGTGVTVASAAAGVGALSLIWGMLTTTIVRTMMLAADGWRRWPPRFEMRWGQVRGHLDFGGYQVGERIVNFATSNVDYVLIGRLLGAGALGTYSLAYQLVVKPLILINPMVTRVAFPILAKRQHDDVGLRRAYLQVVRIIAYITLPLLLGLAVLADDLVAVVLGGKWEASVPMIQILCFVGAVRCLTNPIGTVLLSKDRPDLGFKGNVISLVLMAVALLIAVPHGLVTAAWAEVGMTVLFAAGWLVVLRGLIGLTWSKYFNALWAPVLLAGATSALMLVLHSVVPDLPPVVRLIGLAAVGATFFVGGAMWFDGEWVRGVIALFRKQRRHPETKADISLTDPATEGRVPAATINDGR